MTDKEDRREKAKLVLADRLKNLQAAGFLGFEDIVDHLQNTNTLAHCIANLAKAVGFDKIYGARPVKRVIQNKIEDELALQIIEGRLPTGQIITVGIKDGRLSVK